MPTGNTRDGNCSAVPVIIDGNCTGGGATINTLLGGIYIWPGTAGTALPSASGVPYVTDVQLANTSDGQTIVIYTWTGVAGTTNPNRRVIIEEKRSTNETFVTRQCLKTGASPNDTSSCTTTTGGTWYLDMSSTARGGVINQQRFTGLLSRYPGDGLTPTTAVPLDYAVMFVNNADLGQVNTLNGLRRGTFSTSGATCQPRTYVLSGTAGGTKDCHVTGWSDPGYAIFQSTVTAANGTRLTVAGDGNIWITGHLNYRVDSRGADGDYSEPIPGDPTGTSADDQLDTQSVLGIVSWGTASPWVPTTRAGGVRISEALTGNLETHGMVFVANLGGQAEPSGQFSFDDPNGAYRGISYVLGGVVQKTMGTFGQPSSNLGYERDWVYDERFRYRALSPPAFPGFPNFTAASGLGIDSYSWRLGIFQ
jgi:hypothetical protein